MVPVSELAVGMYVCALDRPWLESPFRFQGFPLQSPEDIEEVQQVCRHVYVDVTRSTQASRKRFERLCTIDATMDKIRVVKRASGQTGPVRRFLARIGGRAAEESIPVETLRSVPVAQPAFDETARFVREVFAEVGAGRSIDIRTAHQTVAGCVEHITRTLPLCCC